MELQALKREVVRYSRRLWQKGYVANHDGNISVRVDGRTLLATPTAMSKEDIAEEDILVLDAATGAVRQGRRKVFSEIGLHLEWYRTRPDANAVVHAHPPVLFAFSCCGVEVDPRITPEAVVSLGDRIPLLPANMPGSQTGKDQIRALGDLYDVLALGNHGVISCGDSLEQAYLRIELAEHLAVVQKHALALGGARLIPEAYVSDLLDRRRKAGLGPEARGIPKTETKKLSNMPVTELLAELVERIGKK